MKLSSGWLARVILPVGLLLGMVRAAAAVQVPDGTKIWLPVVMGGVPNGNAATIGKSVAGRALVVYQYGTGPRKKLILGGIHGGYEWNTIELVNQLMAHVAAHPELVPAGQTLYFLPALNPDGEARGHNIYGRANENNADINRNFNYDWKSDWYRVGCWDYLPITAGTGPFSEPEAAALRDFVLGSGIEALISYHSAAAEIYAGRPADDPVSVNLALAMEQVSGYAYPPYYGTCELTGQLIDWASSRGIAALDVELTNHQDTDFAINERLLEAFLRWSPQK